jgi:HD-like signal output (HDOD) protein
MNAEMQKHWGVDQWAAYLSAQNLPSMRRSKMLLAALEEEKGEALSSRELADVANGDPFLCLRLLRAAESVRSRKLGRDTTTPLAAVLQLGITAFRQLLIDSPEVDDDNAGLAACEARAVLASQLALQWGAARSDIAPEEVQLATLLSETGELLLWSFAPQAAQAALDLIAGRQIARSADAQLAACGFRFRDLTLKCAQIWELPPLLVHLIKGVDNARANLSRLCVDTARHLSTGPENPALGSDLARAAQLMPHASLSWLASCMLGLNEVQREEVIQKAMAILADPPAATV